MEKYSILLGYFDKQFVFVNKLYQEIIKVDVSIYENRFLFAMRAQQFYTALEDLMKQIAKSFENNIDTMHHFHKELLTRMNIEVPKIRPAVLSHQSFLFLDKIRAFRHFIRHAYDCELDENELLFVKKKIEHEFSYLENDLKIFRSYIQKLSSAL